QGTRVLPGTAPIADRKRRAPSAQLQQLELQALRAFNQQHLQNRPGDSQLETRIHSFETAFGMQMEAPDAFDLSRESDATLQLYGLERGSANGFAWQCLVA